MSCKMSVAVEMKYIYIVKYTMFCFENKILFETFRSCIYIYIYGLDHQYPAFFSAECPKMRGKGSALIRSILTFCQNPLRHILTI